MIHKIMKLLFSKEDTILDKVVVLLLAAMLFALLALVDRGLKAISNRKGFGILAINWVRMVSSYIITIGIFLLGCGIVFSILTPA